MERFSIGIDIGGTKTAYGLLDSKNRIISRKTHPSNNSCTPEMFFDEVIDTIRSLMTENHIEKENLRGVGIGLPSFIKFNEGYIVKTSNLTMLRDFPARDYLTERLGGIKVVIDNDAHCAAIAEHRHGAGKGFSNMLYCPVSTGISSGIIIDGKIFRGSYGWAGESGHMILTPGDGVECGCGNQGCFMSWTSGSMIIKHIEKWIADGETSYITDVAGNEKINCSHLAKAYNAGDKLAHKAINQMIKILGVWTFNLYVTLNINCFIFGGGLIKMFRELNIDELENNSGNLLTEIKKVFDTYNKNDMPVYFKEAALSDNLSGDDFGIIGAAELLF
jgi:glucokinase